MALFAPFDRPLALQLLGETARPTVVPPRDPPLSTGIEREERPTARGTRLEVARFLTHVLLGDVSAVRSVLAELEASVDERVVVWSPSGCSRSRTELVTALLESDDAITEVGVSILGTCTAESTVYVEWHLEGQFNNAGFLNDDVLIEPSGGTVTASGVLIMDFRYRRATQIRCYYDALGLLEQVVRPSLV